MTTHELLEKRLENVHMTEEMRARVRRCVVKTPSRRRKASFTLILALLLALASAALAYTQGLFGRMADSTVGSLGEQLRSLDVNASAVSRTFIIPEQGNYAQATVTFDQAYYDGQSLYIAYSIATKEQARLEDTECETGRERIDPPASTQGFEKLYDAKECDILEAYSGFSQAEKSYVSEALARGESVCFRSVSQALSEQPTTLDGISLPPLSGDASTEDGAYCAWIKFESPLPDEARDQEALAIRYLFCRITTYMLFTPEGLFLKSEREEPIPLEFTVPRTARTQTLATQAARIARDAQGNEIPYTLEATLVCSDVSIEATITLHDVPDSWINAIKSDALWDAPADWHPPTDFSLYADGKALSVTDGEMSYSAQEHSLTYTFGFTPCWANTYSLLPNYALADRQEDAVLLLSPSDAQ